MAGPFKLRSGNKSPLEFKLMGSSPLKHPHDTLKQAASHDKDQPHPKSKITKETVVDDSGNPIVEPPTTEKKSEKKKQEEGKRRSPEEKEEVVEAPNPNVKPTGYGLDR